MKDSNGVGEGPYTIKNTVNDLWLVYGPKGPLSGNIGHALAVEICVVANSGYAEGRKAMEKDLRELLSIAEKLYCATDDAFSCPELFAWKKARGIE